MRTLENADTIPSQRRKRGCLCLSCAICVYIRVSHTEPVEGNLPRMKALVVLLCFFSATPSAVAVGGDAAGCRRRRRQFREFRVTANTNVVSLSTPPRGGGVQATASALDDDEGRRRRRTLNTLHQSSFLIVVATTIVGFTPLPALTRHYLKTSSQSSPDDANGRAVWLLALLSAASGASELVISPLIGTVLDSFGRRSPSVLLYGLISLASLGAALRPGLVSICISRIVNTIVGGFLGIVANTSIADLFDDDRTSMGGALARQAAYLSLGFLSGSVAGGRLTTMYEGKVEVIYAASFVLSLLAVLNVKFRLIDTREFTREATERTVFDAKFLRRRLIDAPVASLQLLFSYGKKMRILAIILLLQSAPMLMGDVFQVFAKEQWGFQPKDFGNLIALFGVLGIICNVSLSPLVQRFGLRCFSLFAIASSMLFPITTLFTDTYRYVVVAAVLGLYGQAQKIGTSAAIAGLANDLALPMGKLQGEKASLLALLKIIVPVIYSSLYLTGKKWNTMTGSSRIEKMIGQKLPFVMNVILGAFTFMLTWRHIE